MGVKGLMKLLPLRRVGLEELAAFRRVAVDVSIWLHKFKYVDGCALGVDRQHDGWKEAFKAAFKHLARDAKLLFVFDGATPPWKSSEHARRRVNAEGLRAAALAMLQLPEARGEGRRLLVKLLEVSELEADLKAVLDAQGWEWRCAPFEADAYLAQLSLAGEVDLVLTEDTDLVVYGCENVLFRFSGRGGELYNRTRHVQLSKVADWSLFQKFCVLCGCDYYKVPGVAVGRALKICRSAETFAAWFDKYADREGFDGAVALFAPPALPDEAECPPILDK